MTKRAQDIKKGQIIKVRLQDEITDFTGYVKDLNGDIVSTILTTGWNEGSEKDFTLSSVVSVIEILSSPLFFRLQRTVAGEQEKGQNLAWESVATEHKAEGKAAAAQDIKKPRMLLRAPPDCKYKRI